MTHRTELMLEPADWTLTYRDGVMTLGSCFAENIGLRLERLKYHIEVNPFGTLYNPISIRNSLALLLNQYTFEEHDLFQHDELWHSFQHHSRFSGPDPTQVLSNINHTLERARQALPKLNVLMLTFGTSWVFELKSSGQVVSNCHKLPDSYFVRRRLGVDEMVEQVEPLLEYLHGINPKMRILLSVSPIRHLKDGFAGNQLSKSTLLVGTHQLCARLPFLEYFPAYEMMMDDLRDYRYYAEDMVHPSNLAIDYIWSKFEGRYLSDKEKTLRQRIEKVQRALEHRPVNQHSQQHKFFLDRQLTAMNDLEREFNFLDFSKEKKLH